VGGVIGSVGKNRSPLLNTLNGGIFKI